MSKLTWRNVLSAAWAAALLAGCNGQVDRARMYEGKGECHLAYEEYLQAARSNPDDAAAEQGLRRTASLAAAHWRERADKAAADQEWNRSARYHLKVLQIKPDEQASLEALRQIRTEHPGEFQLACQSLRLGRLTGEPLAMAEAPAAAPEAATPAAPPQAVEPAPAKPKTAEQPKPVATDWRGKPVAFAGLPGPRPPLRVRPAAQPLVQSPYAVLADSPAPTEEPERPSHWLPIAQIDIEHQLPPVRYKSRASRWEFIKTIRLSRDDDAYPKKADLLDGLSMKLDDTDGHPRDADMEIYLGKRRLKKFKNLIVNNVILAYGESAQPYEIVVLEIHDPSETVTLAIRKKQP